MTKRIIEKEMDSELMLYDSQSDEVHVLNATARRIYEMSREGKSREEIVKELRAEFRPEMQEALDRDIQECLEELAEKGLVGR